jgi:hypothetical protein
VAEPVIAKAICHSLWQPFEGPIMPLSSDQLSTPIQISEALARQDRRKENLWRFLTLQGFDIATLPPSSGNIASDQLSLLETQNLPIIPFESLYSSKNRMTSKVT